MLPDFTKLKKELLEEIIIPAFSEARRNDPLLGRIHSTTQFEGKETSYQTVDGNIEKQPYEKFKGEWQITPEEVIEQPFDYFINKFKKMGEDATSQMAQYTFKQINKVIDKTGNVVDAGGKKISPDLILESLEKVLIDFDEDTGNAKFPTVYIHPDQAEAYKKVIEDAKQDPEFKKKFDEMVERKRKEWHDREAVRKLVD